MSDLVLIILILLVSISILYSLYLNNFLNPIFIYTTVLFMSYTIYYLYFYKYLKYQELSNITYYGYILMPLGFIIGYFYTYPFVKVRKVNIKETEFNNEEVENNFFKYIYKIGMIVYAIRVLQAIVTGLSGYGDFFFNLRYRIAIDNKDYFGTYIILFLKVYMLILIVYSLKYKYYNKKIVSLLILFIIDTFFSLARTDILLILISCILTLVLSEKYVKSYEIKSSNKKSNGLIIIGGIITFIAMYFIFELLRGGSIDELIEVFLSYFGEPIISFDKYIVSTLERGYGVNIFEPISNILGINLDYGMYIPFDAFNTYTGMKDPYLDFGLPGIFIINIVIGCIYSYLFEKVRKGNIYAIIYYSIMCFPLVMSFYDYTFSYVLWIYYAIIIIIYSVIIKKNKFKLKLKERNLI